MYFIIVFITTDFIDILYQIVFFSYIIIVFFAGVYKFCKLYLQVTNIFIDRKYLVAKKFVSKYFNKYPNKTYLFLFENLLVKSLSNWFLINVSLFIRILYNYIFGFLKDNFKKIILKKPFMWAPLFQKESYFTLNYKNINKTIKEYLNIFKKKK